MTVLGEGKFLQLVNEHNWEYVRRKTVGVVAVFPLFKKKDGKMYVRLVSQFRPPVQAEVTSTVAGLVDNGENLLNAAKRELYEEAGLTSNQFQYLGCFPSSSGLTDEAVDLFLAFDCKETQDLDWVPDKEEGIRIEDYTLEEFNQFLQTKPGLVDAKLYIAAFYYPIYLKLREEEIEKAKIY